MCLHCMGALKLTLNLRNPAQSFPGVMRLLHIDTARVLGKENKEKCVKALQAMKPLRLRGPMPEKQAAVLVPLCLVNNELSLLYTVRSTNLRTNRGEVSFPGGMQDEGDRDLEFTAARETEEELGISTDLVEIWGRANFVGTYSGKVAVLPVLGFLGSIDPERLKKNPEEVEAVFTMSLRHLCHPSVCRHTQFRTRSLVLPLFVGPEYKVWGLTAVITHLVLKSLIPNHYTKKLRILPPVQPLQP